MLIDEYLKSQIPADEITAIDEEILTFYNKLNTEQKLPLFADIKEEIKT